MIRGSGVLGSEKTVNKKEVKTNKLRKQNKKEIDIK